MPIAAFESTVWRADNIRFDQYLRSDISMLSKQEKNCLFYGKANCGRCHSGNFQTDQGSYAIAMPQTGPRKDLILKTMMMVVRQLPE